MTAKCEHCTGTHYLSDMPDLGPCVCCTPEALQRAETALAARDRTVAALTAEPPLSERIDHAIAALTDAQAEIESREHAAGEKDKEIEALGEDVDNIVAALRAYLPTVGFAPSPITTTNMPDELAELVKAAGLV